MLWSDWIHWIVCDKIRVEFSSYSIRFTASFQRNFRKQPLVFYLETRTISTSFNQASSLQSPNFLLIHDLCCSFPQPPQTSSLLRHLGPRGPKGHTCLPESEATKNATNAAGGRQVSHFQNVKMSQKIAVRCGERENSERSKHTTLKHATSSAIPSVTSGVFSASERPKCLNVSGQDGTFHETKRGNRKNEVQRPSCWKPENLLDQTMTSLSKPKIPWSHLSDLYILDNLCSS